ncbi:MAG: hypothetical protein OHK0057_20120 [Thermoflexibacter sp.]
MLKKILFFALFILFITSAKATHIVGGEIEMTHLGGTIYRFTLNLYFDEINGDPLAIDEFIFPAVFRKSDNAYIGYITLPKISDTPIPYTDPKCVVGSLKTRHIVYLGNVNLAGANLTDPQGYYISWERCCRNKIIENIIEPESAGQTFYMEFPALEREGSPFLNSTPVFPKPNNPYACLNQPFTLSFAASDADGDQLTYTLRTPANGNSNPLNVAPFGFSAPYLPVQWRPGYSVNNMIRGNPPMQINASTGLMTFTPTETGLFVFAVVCEERRNGVKIGEVVREFQIMVLDCGGNNPPQARLKLIDSEEFYDTSDVLPISVSATNKCTKLQVTDIDNNTRIKASIVPINFADASGILLQNSGTITNGSTDKLLLDVCFDRLAPRCEPYEMDFVVEDNTCGSPLRNTLRVKVLVIGNENNAIIPILECISLNEDGSRTATFGYESFNTTAIQIPNGRSNRLVGVSFHQQPTTFQTGRWYNVFQVTYTGTNVPTWEIASGSCNKNISSITAPTCATPCSPEKERYLIQNQAQLTFHAPEALTMDFQEGSYLEFNANGSAYIYGKLKVSSSEVADVPVNSSWILRMYLDKSAKAFCPDKDELGEAILATLLENWDYLELNGLETSFTQVNGTGTISLAHRYGENAKNFSPSNCYGFQIGMEANGKPNSLGGSGLFYFSINYRDRDTKGSLNISLERTCFPECQDFAIKVISYDERTRKDGQPIDDTPNRQRNRPENALGRPQENDLYNFVSLGFGGNIVLELGSPVYNHNKYGLRAAHNNTLIGKEVSLGDIIVVETSFGRINQHCGQNQDQNYPERARFYGTESLSKPWVVLGEGCRTTFVDVAPAIRAGHKFVKYLMVEDISDIDKFIYKDEGYDVDGVIICPEEVANAITGSNGRRALLDARVEGSTYFDGEFFNHAPNQDMRFEAQIYPNPFSDKLLVNILLQERTKVEITVFDVLGKIVKQSTEVLQEGYNQVKVELAHINKGLYVVKIKDESGQNQLFKMVKD